MQMNTVSKSSRKQKTNDSTTNGWMMDRACIEHFCEMNFVLLWFFVVHAFDSSWIERKSSHTNITYRRMSGRMKKNAHKWSDRRVKRQRKTTLIITRQVEMSACNLMRKSYVIDEHCRHLCQFLSQSIIIIIIYRFEIVFLLLSDCVVCAIVEKPWNGLIRFACCAVHSAYMP